MEESVAKKLVKDTFEHSFSEKRFFELTRNILKDSKTISERQSLDYLPSDHIQSAECVGKYQDGEKHIDILVTHLKRDSSLDRARTAQRNYIAKYLRNNTRDAAIVAYVAPNKVDWRFSLVTLEYTFNEGGTVSEQLTPARRHSFLVGENEKSHTAQRSFLPILCNDEKPKFEKIKEAFAVESVTKEFFSKYSGLCTRLEEELEKIINKDTKIRADFKLKNIILSDFAKKLLGQIVFLYFLQKKGWLGVERGQEWGSGPKHFLRELFNKERGSYKNFFNDILELLFYEALQSEHAGDYYRSFGCRIPFLNGGLFEPINDYDWRGTKILLPDDIFSNKCETKEGDIGDGILDIFDRYNFTVKEDEPLEKEVAIDPEMLGKVFEKLLKDPNEKGTFYTPREIVHYMCKESLLHYLIAELEGKVCKGDIEKIVSYGATYISEDEDLELPESVGKNAKLVDKKLENVRVCDPAVGSGAFPVGMMNEIVRIRSILTPRIKGERSPYHFKRKAIQNCLYGIDIDPSAIEIAKLRLWLSLVVDEEDRKRIQPLPNLDYKIVLGDSLKEMGDGKITRDSKRNKIVEQMNRSKEKFFNITDPKDKRRMQERIKQLAKELSEHDREVKIRGWNNEISQIGKQRSLVPKTRQMQKEEKDEIGSLRSKIKQEQEKREEYFEWDINFSEVFQEKEGFDILIANPPYIQLQKGGGELRQRYQDGDYKVFNSSGDIYQLFYEKGYQHLRKSGCLCYITSNKWMRASYGEELRRYFVEQTQPSLLLDLGPDVFDATVDTNVLLVEKKKEERKNLKALTLDQQNRQFPPDKKKLLSIPTPEPGAPWLILGSVERKLKEKIEKIGTPLKEWDISIYRGILTGYDKAFVIDNETKEALIRKDPKSAEIIKPLLRGRDVRAYRANWREEWLIDSHNGYGDIPRIDVNDYKAIKTHLDYFHPQLENRQDQGATPYNLRNCAYHADFEKEKIIYSEIVQAAQFYFDDIGEYYCEATTFLITGKELKTLCGIFNSKPFDFFFKHWYAGGGLGEKGYRYKKKFLEQVPVPKFTANNKVIIRKINSLVGKILNAKNNNMDTEGLRNSVDKLVCKLYEFTDKEIDLLTKNK